MIIFLFQAQLEQLENELKESNGNYENLQRSFLELTEVKHILQKTQLVMSEESAISAIDSTALNNDGQVMLAQI